MAPGFGADAGEAVCDPAGDATLTGAVAGEGDGEAAGICSGPDCSTERDPLIAGNDNMSAISMKAAAAPMVIFARMLCVPRGPNAVLETLLVNSAPASALPGCSSTTMISTRQAKMNNP